MSAFVYFSSQKSHVSEIQVISIGLSLIAASVMCHILSFSLVPRRSGNDQSRARMYDGSPRAEH